MGRIRILDDSVAKRIAAGEVVERPSSIIKELVENSIDAMATSVSIEIEDGGITSLKVTDNGQGILKEDMKLAVQKHATSKILSVNDLENVYTMGFRGEALSSIAAVSHLKIRSRVPNSDCGSEIYVKGGKIQYLKDIGAPDGTCVSVEGLFFNTPARLKFLKKPGTEAAMVSDIVSKLALAYPKTAIKYTSNKKLMLHTPGNGDLLDTIISVYGPNAKNQLIEINYQLSDIKVHGFVSKPAFTFRSQKQQSVFINRRYVRSELIQKAVSRAYGERILKGDYPMYVLHISMPFSGTDVNVHPNKLTVHIADEQKLEYIIINAVSEALNAAPPTPVINVVTTPPEKKEQISDADLDNAIAEMMSSNSFDNAKGLNLAQTVDYSLSTKADEPIHDFSSDYKNITKAHTQSEPTTVPFLNMDDYDDIKIDGTIFNTYIIAECKDVVYIIDQHAAHERIMFEKLKKQYESGSVPSQGLLIPEKIHLSHEDMILLNENSKLINDIGINMSLSNNICTITAMPTMFGITNAQSLLDEIINDLKNGTDDILMRRNKIIRASCKSAVKAKMALPGDVVRSIVRDIIKLGTVPNCPHGRPVAVCMKKSDIEKSFRRIV